MIDYGWTKEEVLQLSPGDINRIALIREADALQEDNQQPPPQIPQHSSG